MIKFTSYNRNIYLKKACLYGFDITEVRGGYLLRLLGTDGSNYDLGEFQSKEICEYIITKVKSGLIFGIVDIDKIIEEGLKDISELKKE